LIQRNCVLWGYRVLAGTGALTAPMLFLIPSDVLKLLYHTV
jgi:hypothetical protein